MNIPLQSFDQFFAPLVGDRTQAEQLRTGLVAHVNAGDIEPIDPYARLETGLTAAIQQIADDHIAHASFTRTDTRRWEAMRENGITGGKLTVATLRTVGGVYEDGAEVPQDEANVTRNTSRALRYMYGMAFGGKLTGFMNFGAISRGLNPKNPLAIPAILLAGMANDPDAPKVSTKAFVAEADHAGQLAIRPRHQRLNGVNGHQCPGTEARVSDGEHTKSALLTLVKTVGSVAVSEIFPQQFSIVQDALLAVGL